MAKAKYKKRERGYKKTYTPDLFQSLSIAVPKTLLPALKSKGLDLGLSLERACAIALYKFISLDWSFDLQPDPTLYGDAETSQLVFGVVSSIPKGVAIDQICMLEGFLRVDKKWILVSLEELVLTKDLEYFDFEDGSKGVKLHSRHILKRRIFRRFAGEVQR